MSNATGSLEVLQPSQRFHGRAPDGRPRGQTLFKSLFTSGGQINSLK